MTAKYLDGNDPNNPRLALYYDAVASWENLALQVSMAFDLFRWLNDGAGAFKKNDGSPEQRLYTIANQVKHLSSCVESGQCSDADVVPLWLTNTGLNSFGSSVTFNEVTEVVRDLARLADRLQDPLSFAGEAPNVLNNI